jgi:hypothetical protein
MWRRAVTERDQILTRSTAQAIQAEKRDRFLLWTVYVSPTDFPGIVVIRPCFADETYQPLSCHIEAQTLEEARAMLPRGLTNIGRDKRNDPLIKEVWI